MSDCSANGSNNVDDKKDVNDDPIDDISTTGPSASSSGLKRKHDSSEDEGITMLDVLKDEEAMEEDAKAVLGNADDKNCSYHIGGYMKRQALYACVTCSVPDSPDFQPAALCLACSYHCHPSHEVVELYTKRHFRCDCGNNRLKDNACKLANDKSQVNDSNKYNQNFKGVYCICHRPYPDPEDDTPDQMIQCIICEDWYHGRHLEGIENPPSDDSYSEMICHICCEKHKDFLLAYKGLAVTKVTQKNGVKNGKCEELEVCDDEQKANVTNGADHDSSVVEDDKNKNQVGEPGDVKSESTSGEAKNGIEHSPELNAEPGGDVKPCLLKSANFGSDHVSALFLPGGWRDQLCACYDCKRMYSEKDLEFLLDPEDTVHFYESTGLAKGGTQYEEGLKALGEMDRVKQVEAIRGYNEMKESLKDFLKKFADEGKIVTQEDIQEFFATMKATKRPRVEIPEFCR